MSNPDLLGLIDYPLEDHQVRLMVGDPIALAAEWILHYLDNLNSHIDEDDGSPIDIDELIITAMSHIEEGGWGDYISRGGAFEGFNLDPTFWDKLAIIKKIDIPQDKRGSFFGCSC